MTNKFNRFLIRWVSKAPIRPRLRAKLLKKAGIDLQYPVFIGSGVVFDTANPSGIHIKEQSMISANVIILSHFLDNNSDWIDFRKGDVRIGKGAFIGAGAIICNSVTIGDYAIVGAGSVVTKDIPPFEIWAGNPAHFIKRRPNIPN